jgi:Phosphotransferase enzyme family
VTAATEGASSNAGGRAGTLDAMLGELGLCESRDRQLEAMVSALLDAPAEILSVHVERYRYDLPALTTRDRFHVSGTARTIDGQRRPYAFFVKVIQSWARSPLSHEVPGPLRAGVATLLPWRTEPDLYLSDLRDRLPAGLTVPRAFGVFDLDGESTAVWLDMVPARTVTWDVERHQRAAYLLGRLAASPAVTPLAARISIGRTARLYADVWLAHNVIPELYRDDMWRHPLLVGAFDATLRARMLAAVTALPRLLDELDTVPLATAHGDACTRNLLVTDTDDCFTMIDFGFWGTAPVGFDLGQLLLGEIQVGERPAIHLPVLEQVCLPAYVNGLHDEGDDITLHQVRRSHAVLMTIFHAIPAIPYEHRTAEPTPQLRKLYTDRAATARFILDLLDNTAHS